MSWVNIQPKVCLIIGWWRALCFFYGFWNPIYLVLFVFSLLFNYLLGKKIAEQKEKNKSAMLLGVGVNLALLAYFKYFNFFVDNMNSIFEISFQIKTIVLPLAISFFTFQQIAYLVDAYESKTEEYQASHYFLFITFFPQLIAGPIVHHAQLMPQFSEDGLHQIKNKNIALGLTIFGLGLAKKVIIADTFAIWANEGFANIDKLEMVSAWLTSLSYTFQLYFDFSGYSEMAIGSALLFNIRLPLNFNSPYRALSIQDFWRRLAIYYLGIFTRFGSYRESFMVKVGHQNARTFGVVHYIQLRKYLLGIFSRQILRGQYSIFVKDV